MTNKSAETLVAVERERERERERGALYLTWKKLNKIDTKDVEKTSLKNIYKKTRRQKLSGSDP